MLFRSEEIVKWRLSAPENVYIFSDKKDYNIMALQKPYDYYILNYEKLAFYADKASMGDYESSLWNLFNKITKEDFVLIYDEMYKIKNNKSKLCHAHRNFRKGDWAGIIGLTGTPLENNLWEFYNLLNFIQPNTITYDEMQRYFIYDTGYVRAFRNLDLFNRMANKIMYRVTKEEVKADLPKLVQEYRYVKHKAKAHDIKAKLLARYPIFECYTTLRVLDSYASLESDANYTELLEEAIEHNAKLEELENVLEEIGDNQILIFTSYETTALWLKSKLKEYKVEVVSGSTKDKDSIRDRFIKGDTQIVIATNTWSYGVNLSNINYMILWDAELNPSKLSQKIMRIHRLDSTEPKLVVHLISDIIEADIMELIKNKIELSEKAVEGVLDKDLLGSIAKKWGVAFGKGGKSAE